MLEREKMRYDHLNMLPYAAFKKLGKHMTYEGGGKGGGAPDTPDLTGAAKATAQGNIEAARVAAAANRVSQYTPYGNLVYSQTDTPIFDQYGYDQAMANYNKALSSYQNSTPAIKDFFGLTVPGTGRGGPMPVAPTRDQFMSKVNPDSWKATVSLSPAEQAKLDANNKLSLGLLDTAQNGLSNVNQLLSKPFDFSQLPAAQINAGQTAQDALFSRLDPKFTQSEEALRTRLINQGVRPGSQAWDNEFNNFSQGKNDAYLQAGLQSMDIGQRARQQALQEQEFGRTEGLNVLNALRSGGQVTQPNFVSTPQQATTAGADLLGATTQNYQNQIAGYNANQAAGANTTNGLLGLAGTAASFFGF